MLFLNDLNINQFLTIHCVFRLHYYPFLMTTTHATDYDDDDLTNDNDNIHAYACAYLYAIIVINKER